MFLRIVFKSIIINFHKTLIILFSVALGAAIVSAFASIYFDINTKMSKELRTFGSNFFIGSANPDKTSSIKINVYQKALNLIQKDKILAQTGLIYGIVRLDLANAILSGINFSEAKKINPFWQIEGSWISVDFDDKNCMVGVNLAKNMELKVGSFVTITNHNNGFSQKFKVKGIIESGQNEDNQIFVNLALAQKILGVKEQINFATLSLKLNSDEMEQAANLINQNFPELNAKPIRKVSFSEGKILLKIKGLMAMIASMILIITTLCVSSTLVSQTQERNKEVGLQKALGANNKVILKQYLSEISIIAIFGIIIGLLTGFLLAQIMGNAIFGSNIQIRAQVVPLTFTISFLASLVAAFLPIKKLLRILPAQVLRGE